VLEPEAPVVNENDFLPTPEVEVTLLTSQDIDTVSRLAAKLRRVIVTFELGLGLSGVMLTNILLGETAKAGVAKANPDIIRKINKNFKLAIMI